ncbi:DUF3862 domain-containing protein [Agrilactobacillus yilanensis]|uniref:DUF3862 domain-containing protein n=1 Tax=Agrilactobacillus yilanensis TaxID=2485997 RepID=A0ABW4JBP4_9LACO|nr:DUF3862 domain-containing protein [Agrilactobacillus yilanensis]
MKNLQNQIEALLNHYQLTHLIDPNQVRVNLNNQDSDYAMIQAIFNDQIEQATQRRDWQRMIDLLKAMVQLSQNIGNYDDTITAEVSLLYLTYSRYYNTDLLQAELNPTLMDLQVIMQQGNTSYETLDALIQNVVANLTVPNNLPLGLDANQALHEVIQQAAAKNTSSQQQLPPAQASLDETIDNLHQESLQRRKKQPQNQDQPTEPADVADEDYDDDQDNYEDPFYKKWWFWTLIVLIVLIIAIILKLVITKVTTPSVSSEPATEQVSKSSSVATQKKKSKSHSSSQKSSSAATQTNNQGVSFNDFNSVKVDDFSKSAPDGSTLTDLTAKFGKPYTTSKVTQDGLQATVATWQPVDGQKNAAISVSFIEQRAFSKSLNDYQPETTADITLNTFNNLAVGQSADEILGLLGLPNEVNDVYINDSTQVTYTYNRDNAKIILTFIANKLQGKTQTGLD